MQQPFMQEPWRVSPAMTHPPQDTGKAAHPVLRYALIFGLVIGVFALVQVGVSVVAAQENRTEIASFYYGLHGAGIDVNALGSLLGPVLAAAYGSCLVAFLAGMWLCWYAGRAAAFESGRRSAGAQAGLLASATGSLIWLAGGVVAALLFHTDGSISGILTTQPDLGATTVSSEVAGLLTQEVVAGLLALGFGALVGWMGGGAALEARTKYLAALPTPGAYLQMPVPALPAAPYTLPLVYPPSPDLYRQNPDSAGQPNSAPPPYLPPYFPHYPPPAAYSAYPAAPPWYPPSPSPAVPAPPSSLSAPDATPSAAGERPEAPGKSDAPANAPDAPPAGEERPGEP